MKILLSISLFLFFLKPCYSQDSYFSTTLPEFGSFINEGIYLNRNSGFLRIINGTGLNGEFQPRISGLADSDISPGLVLVGTPSLINSNARGVLIRAGETNSMSQGNVLQISNYTNSLMVVDHEGKIGIDTDSPSSKLHLHNGDIFLEDINSGIIMKSENGTCWRFRPSDFGKLEGVEINCPD